MAENKRYYWLKLMDDFFDSKRIKKTPKDGWWRYIYDHLS